MSKHHLPHQFPTPLNLILLISFKFVEGNRSPRAPQLIPPGPEGPCSLRSPFLFLKVSRDVSPSLELSHSIFIYYAVEVLEDCSSSRPSITLFVRVSYSGSLLRLRLPPYSSLAHRWTQLRQTILFGCFVSADVFVSAECFALQPPRKLGVLKCEALSRATGPSGQHPAGVWICFANPLFQSRILLFNAT